MSMWNYVSNWGAAPGDDPSGDQEQSNASASASVDQDASGSALSSVNDAIVTLRISEVEISPISTSTGSSLANSPKTKKHSPASSSDESFEIVSENVSRKSSVSRRDSHPNLDIYRAILDTAFNSKPSSPAKTPEPSTSEPIVLEKLTVDQYADMLISTYEDSSPDQQSTSNQTNQSKPGYLTLAALSASSHRSTTAPTSDSNTKLSVDEATTSVQSTDVRASLEDNKSEKPTDSGHLTLAALAAYCLDSSIDGTSDSNQKLHKNDISTDDGQSTTSARSTEVEASSSIAPSVADTDSILGHIELPETITSNLQTATSNLPSTSKASDVTSSQIPSGYNPEKTCPETIALCRQQVDLIPHLRTGTVKWFSPTRGFGFIFDKDGNEVFVHQTALKMNGFCFLRPNEKVMFTARKRPNRLREQVVDVIGSRLVQQSNYERSRVSRKMYRCYNCGEFSDHMADSCPVPQQTKLCCYICLSDQHLRADCPTRNVPNARHDHIVLLPMSHVLCAPPSLNARVADTSFASSQDSAYISETSFSDELIEHQPPDPGIFQAVFS